MLVKLSQLVHPTWFPYPLASTIHAARTSIAYQANARRSPTPLPWATYIAGYLIMVRIQHRHHSIADLDVSLGVVLF